MEEFLHFILLPETFYGIINNIHVAARAIYIVKKIRGITIFDIFIIKFEIQIYIYILLSFLLHLLILLIWIQLKMDIKSLFKISI